MSDEPRRGGEESSEFSETLRAIERQIAEHPTYVEYSMCRAFGSTIAVFLANLKELREMLERASTDWELAFELVQNVRKPVVRERFESEVDQRLHNYLASSMTLVDHARRLTRSRTGPTIEEFERRKKEFLARPEPLFVQDLRNFTLHRALPFLAHTLSMNNVNKENQSMESEVELGTSGLLEWDGWSSSAHAFLESQGEAVKLRPTITAHGRLMYDLNSWLHNQVMGAIDLGKVNELVIQRNMVLTGADREAAVRLSQERWENSG